MRRLWFASCLLLLACAASTQGRVRAGGDDEPRAEASAEVNGGAGADSSGPSSSPSSGPSKSEPPSAAADTRQLVGPGVRAPEHNGAHPSCPVRCYVAEGARRFPMSAEDEARMGQAFADVFADFRDCEGGRRRHYHSPMVNLRFSARGELAEEGYDLEGFQYGDRAQCFASVPRRMPSVAGPPSSTVRCREVCPLPARAPRAPRVSQKPASTGTPQPAKAKP